MGAVVASAKEVGVVLGLGLLVGVALGLLVVGVVACLPRRTENCYSGLPFQERHFAVKGGHVTRASASSC